jgi:hypothetical protein
LHAALDGTLDSLLHPAGFVGSRAYGTRQLREDPDASPFLHGRDGEALLGSEVS